MAEFNVTPEILRATASNIDTIKDNIKGKLDNINAEIERMKPNWDSSSAETFIAKFKEMKGKFEGYYEVIMQYSKFLRDAAETYEKSDNKIKEAANNLFT